MESLIALVAAVQFLLVSPAFIRRAFTPRELGHATGFYPLVGLLLGALLVLADALLGLVFPAPVRSALILAIWLVLTGALHFDGFLDACDGLLGGTTTERRLEIMRDERVGAYGVAGGAVLLLIMFASLSAVAAGQRWAILLLAPVLSRWGMTLAVVAFPYARPQGLGRDVKEHARAPQAAIATVTAFSVAAGLSWRLGNYLPVAAMLAAGLVWWMSARFVLGRIPGMSGDTYGAVNVLIEAAILLTAAAMQ